jgi:hypothetical protein
MEVLLVPGGPSRGRAEAPRAVRADREAARHDENVIALTGSPILFGEEER